MWVRASGMLLQRAMLRPGKQIQDFFGGVSAVRVVICQLCTLLAGTWGNCVEGTRALLPEP